jgi:hypothetical protein
MSRCLFVSLGCFSIGLGSGFAAPVSLNIQNWNVPTYGSYASEGADGDGNYLRINTVHPDYSSQILQNLVFDKPVVKVVFTGEMKTENVTQGLAPINCARAQVVFLTDRGERTGGWPEATNVSRVQPWTSFRQELAAPQDGKALRLMLGFYLSTGTADYRNLDIQAFDLSGQPVDWKLAGPEKTDTTGWWPWPFPDEDATRPIVCDFGPWLRKPDDARVLGIKGDKFVWSDGTEARFWGTNIGTSGDNNILTSSHQEIDAIVDFYARQGCNLVRLHQMDSGIFTPPAGLFFPNADNTSSFDPDRLDRFDYLTASLKRAGISILFDLLDTRKFRSGDGVADDDKLDYGAKIAGEFDPKIIELEKDYARRILCHVNPYTKLALKDDPALVLMNIINESTIFSASTYAQLPESYRKELGAMFDDWCRAPKPRVARPPGEIAELLSQGDPTVIRFLDATQTDYFQGMASFLRDELKVKVPILGSNHGENHVGDVASNARLGFLDRHAYWDGPQGGWSEKDAFGDRPMVRGLLDKDSMLESIATQRIAHHPFTVSEWNSCWPNEYIAEAPLLISTYGSLQGWNGFLNFGLNGHTSDRSGRMSGPFNNGNRPHFMAAFSAAALIYLRGDIAIGTPFEVPLDTSNLVSPAGQDIVPERVLKNQVGCVLPEEGGAVLKTANEIASTPDVIKSVGGQLEWHSNGLVRINTPKTQGYVGFAESKPVQLTDCTMHVSTPFAVVVLISLDGLPLAHSRHFLVEAVARAENTGQIYRPFRQGLVSPGTTPVLVEPVHASILLRQPGASTASARPASSIGQFVVDRYGRRGEAVSIAQQSLDGIRIDLGSTPGLEFEITLN